MSTPPDAPKIYHITPVDNIPGIIAEGQLLSDATMIARGGPAAAIGMSDIKERRVRELEVDCHPGTKVGDYVPFYFCPRSLMLYVIWRANHPDLRYRGGQEPIVHLAAELHAVVAWADVQRRRWAFSLSNAGARYTEFRARLDQLGEIDWPAVSATDFRAAAVQEGKQAEFLLHECFPWTLVRQIGVQNAAVERRVREALAGADHQPPVRIEGAWYYP